MDIEDAFTEEAITALDTNVVDDVEAELREVITKIFVSNEITWSDGHVNVALLAFVAGRTYQSDLQPDDIQVSLPTEVWKEFIQFMIARGTHD